jgi:hypothetical protein
LAVLGPQSAALSAPERRSVAVLEFRQDVSALPGLAEQMAERIGKLTGLRVVGPVEARQKLGTLLDSFVARCQGEPRCVGAIGSRLGVKEVILVGMSSLGDVIIQISRIQADTRKILASVAHTMPGDGTLASNAIESFIRRLLPPADFLRYGFIQVRSSQPGAAVRLGEDHKGVTPLGGPIRVKAPSTHDIKVTKPGFVPFSAQVQVPPEATIQVNADLPPVPVAARRYYRTWWFWTAVATGVAVVAGVTAGVTLTLQKGDPTVPAVIRW